MAESSDPPPPNLSSSPKITSPLKTLNESSPTAPIRDLVTHSLALSSPIRSSPVKSLTEIQTLATSTQISPANNNNNNNNLLQLTKNRSDSYLYSRSENRQPKRSISNFDFENDIDSKNESTKPIQFSWSYPKIEPTGVGAGLYNSGNTCFIASVLQCFTHTVPLIESLRSYVYQNPCNCGSEKFCVMQALRDHIELALRSSGHGLNVDGFRDNLNHFSSDFQINHQEDAHEFLQSFLDKLERCCLDPKNMPGSISNQDFNIVDHVFGGRLMSTLRCCSCDSSSDTFEPSLGWSLEIEDVDNLWSALESFTCVEKLEDQFTCDNCKEKVYKEKQLKLDMLPPVATFHLKRFKNDGVTMEKIGMHVQFPLELDLSPYMSTNHDPEVSTKYHLYAFVEHIGNGFTFGHYSSYVRSAPETWHSFDDSKVRRVSEEYVLSQDAYILFYAREGTRWFSSAYEELKVLFEATPLNFSPKSVLESTCRQECASEHNYENVASSSKAYSDLVEGVSIPEVNYSDFRCHEPQEEVFHSVECSSDEESSMVDPLESHEAYESDKSFAETSQQREPNLWPSDNTAMIGEAHVPVLKVQNQDLSPKHKDLSPKSKDLSPKHKDLSPKPKDLSPKRKAGERATHGGAYGPKLKIQKQDSPPKRQGRTFQIERAHLQTKKEEEPRRRKPAASRSHFTSPAADPKDKKYALSYLHRNPTSRSLKLLRVLGSSPIKKKKISKHRRTVGLL
ncbi:Ubiquitin carboxyl-terminal hydrolase 21 [Cardamine amara subsp. amara]|uniref:Ubiquitin carboxyl-terminal hydrolase n=1 Tax=Cardamine amara subsp. amara TaxID=228776 RepID=A0ABD0ZFS9_CARAN